MAANQVNINLQVTNRNDVPYASIPAKLYQPSPTIIQTGTTDGSGRILFTGIAAGTYDIGVTISGTERFMTNYVVQNQYSVPMGTTSFSYESKSFVTDQTSTVSPGILGQLNGVVGSNYVASSTTAVRSLFPNTGTTFATTVTINESKPSGTSYYHTTSALTFSQNAKMKV